MKYLEVEFLIDKHEESVDLLAAMIGDIGFEAFESSDHVLKGYIQQPLFSEELLNAVINDFPFADTR